MGFEGIFVFGWLGRVGFDSIGFCFFIFVFVEGSAVVVLRCEI